LFSFDGHGDHPVTFRFIHAADLHLDSPVTGVSLPPDPVFRALRDASLAAFDALIAMAIGEHASFVLLAGDTYDGPHVGMRGEMHLRDGLKRLSEAGITTVIYLSPTDPPPDEWLAREDWPRGIHLLRGDTELVVIEQDEREVATVSAWNDSVAPLDHPGGTSIKIGVLHDQAPDIDAATHAGFDYLALGGSHVRHVYSQDPWVVDAGTLHGRSLLPNERGSKGATVVTVEESGVQGIEFIPMETVRFVEIALDVSEISSISGVQSALTALATEQTPGQEDPLLVVSAALSGSGPVHEALAAPGAAPSLLQALRALSATTGATIWWSALQDETSRQRDRTAIQARGDLSGELVATSRMLLDHPDRAHQVLATAPGSKDLDEHDLVPLLAEAEERALDLLEQPEEA
jgi:hypothetical protein